uniref:Uncharacterized protein n=1 Tax=Solanum demissum TaxID=50514 RepID=Q6L407_SOLDE|nr:hypothetical protein SDM1_44t00011 [Solanum demissum]
MSRTEPRRRYPGSASSTPLIQLSTPESVVSAELRKPGQGFAWGQKWSPGTGPAQGVVSGLSFKTSFRSPLKFIWNQMRKRRWRYVVTCQRQGKLEPRRLCQESDPPKGGCTKLHTEQLAGGVEHGYNHKPTYQSEREPRRSDSLNILVDNFYMRRLVVSSPASALTAKIKTMPIEPLWQPIFLEELQSQPFFIKSNDSKLRFTLRGGKPLASESKGFAFWVKLVALGLPSAGYLFYVVCELLHRSWGFTLCAPNG